MEGKQEKVKEIVELSKLNVANNEVGPNKRESLTWMKHNKTYYCSILLVGWFVGHSDVHHPFISLINNCN